MYININSPQLNRPKLFSLQVSEVAQDLAV